MRAEAFYGAGNFEECVGSEDLHPLLVQRGERVEAGRVAAMTAMYSMMDTGLMAPVRGWLRTAERHLEGTDDHPVRAIIAMVRAYERFMCGSMPEARVHATVAVELGERFGVMPAVVIGRTCLARLTIFDGEVDLGLGLLDEVGALLMSGAADPLTTGMMYCEIICAAAGLMMTDLAAQWTEVMEHWRHGAAFGGINGRCRVHRAWSSCCGSVAPATSPKQRRLRPAMSFVRGCGVNSGGRSSSSATSAFAPATSMGPRRPTPRPARSDGRRSQVSPSCSWPEVTQTGQRR